MKQVSIRAPLQKMDVYAYGRTVLTTINVRAAQKDHVCCECRGSIYKGAPYQRKTGVVDGGNPFTFKTCQACALLREDVCINVQGVEGYPKMGELYAWLEDNGINVEDGKRV